MGASSRDTLQGEVTQIIASIASTRAEPRNVERLLVACLEKKAAETAQNAEFSARKVAESTLDQLREE